MQLQREILFHELIAVQTGVLTLTEYTVTKILPLRTFVSCFVDHALVTVDLSYKFVGFNLIQLFNSNEGVNLHDLNNNDSADVSLNFPAN